MKIELGNNKQTGARFVRVGSVSLSKFTHFVSGAHCHVLQLRKGARAKSVHWPVRKFNRRDGVKIGLVEVRFGILEAGQGWSRRFRGFRVLWRGNQVWQVKLGAVV